MIEDRVVGPEGKGLPRGPNIHVLSGRTTARTQIGGTWNMENPHPEDSTAVHHCKSTLLLPVKNQCQGRGRGKKRKREGLGCDGCS